VTSQAAAPFDRRIWIDGRLVPWAEATVHVLSHSHQRGSLIFDFMSVHATARGPAVFRLRDHVARFLRSADLVSLPLRQSAAEIEAAIHDAVRANPGTTSVKLSAYLPSIEVDVVPADERVSLAVAAYDSARDVLAPKGITGPRRPALRVWIEKELRNRREDILPPQAKVAANYVSPMVAKWRARRRGFDEILLLDERGCVAEGPTTNVFLVDAEGWLRTPGERHVLLGVTRAAILEIAKHDGIPVAECDVWPEDLLAAREVFLTGTSAVVWPVESVDGHAVGSGGAGPLSLQLKRRFEEVSSGRDPDFLHWLSVVEA
jgi:branched-chain amino acid aminotransferase